jgi:hypothetical protein
MFRAPIRHCIGSERVGASYPPSLAIIVKAMILQVAALAFLCAQSAKSPTPTPGHPILLPTEYMENRFAVVPVTENGRKLKFYTDSAGACILSLEDAEALKLPITSGENGRSCPFPTFKPSALIPAPTNVSLRLISQKDLDENVGPGLDGMLGQQWFGSYAWTFDYPAKKLYWRAPGDLPKHTPDHEAKLYFKTDAKGARDNNFARIEIEVDGEKLSFTLDTGAEDILPPAVLKEVNDGRPAERATSFLAQSIYEKWHAKHPDWKVITTPSLTGRELIEVPKITLGGYEVGPVWFSVQPDKAFHQFMAQWTDQPTEGSIGGSAFKYFRMTVDWPNAVAVFEKG